MSTLPNNPMPPSSSSVRIRIIDTTSKLENLPLYPFITPVTPGFTHINCPSHSFLIEHPRHPPILFDLGIRKDWQSLPPSVVALLKKESCNLVVQKSVHQILEEANFDATSIAAIIWSHHHFDHTGDPSAFAPHTKLIVGPGFKDSFMPGYPENPESTLLQADYAGREVVEIAFSDSLEIGRFRAHDYFGDGSFYLLDSPGHSVGHMSGLARLANGEFVLMGGDACHHCGEFRPSHYLPLPETIQPNPVEKNNMPCPGAVFERLLRDGDRGKSLYAPARGDGPWSPHDADESERTVEKIQEADARGDTLVVIAHDDTLKGVIDFFPKYVEGFVEKELAGKVRWKFLKDFKDVVGI